MAHVPKRLFVISILFGIILGVFSSIYSGNINQEKKHIFISFQKVSVMAKVADNDALWVLGLSGIKSLSDKEGLWFDFLSDGRHSIWMKEMNFPIDIIWFDKNFQVVYIKENATPESFPETFTPTSFDRFVLEVPSGFVQKYAVFLGEKVTVNKTP